MAAVEGMMKWMQLSAAEKKGTKIAMARPARSGPALPQVVGKVLVERLVNTDGLA